MENKIKIDETKLFFCDFETGGLEHYTHAVSSFYIEKYNSTYNKTFYFYPQKSIYEFGALKVNGLNLENLYEKGLSREDLIKEFNIINESYKSKQNYIILAGWNVMFDVKFLLNIYKLKSAKLPCPIIALDLKEVASKNIKKKDKRKKDDDGIENYSLVTVYQYLFDDFQEELAHTCDYDVKMTIKIYDKFKSEGWI